MHVAGNNLKFKVACIICFLFTVIIARAQKENGQKPSPISQTIKSDELSWDDFIDMFTNTYQADEENNASQEDKLENLLNIHNNRININTATREELLQLPFLSPAQADSILSYIAKYGPMLSLGELMLIPRLDYQTRRFLTVFLKCDAEAISKPTLHKMLFGGKNEFAVNATTPFYTEEGYKTESNISNSSKYLGDKNHLAIRYRYDYNGELQYGLTTEKDAGEPFACRGNVFTDSYSFYFYRRQRNGRYAFALGDYRIRFAEGLIMGNGYSYGKKGALYDTYNNRRSISPHTSTSECDFLRGASGFTRFGIFTATAFVSYNKTDAILNSDGEITSFPKTGYHRTLTEQERRNNTGYFVAGANLEIGIHKWKTGIAAAITQYDRKINPRQADYNRYAMRGKNFRAASAHYSFNGKSLTCRGEAAISERYATAFINTIKWRLMPYVTLTSIQRRFSKRYAEPFSETFKTSGRVTNEQGVFTGISAEVSNSLILRGYIDFYRMPWASYTYRAPMNGTDYSAEIYLHNYENDYISLEWRGSHKICDKGYAAADTVPINRNLLKLSGKISSGKFSFYSNLSGTVTGKRKKTSKGWMINQRTAYKLKNMQINGSLSYFNTDDYASRLYAYENNVMYKYNLFSAMYGHGLRFSTLGKLKIGKGLFLECKYAETKYFDRSTTGNGAQKINSSYRSNISIMARMVF